MPHRPPTPPAPAAATPKPRPAPPLPTSAPPTVGSSPRSASPAAAPPSPPSSSCSTSAATPWLPTASSAPGTEAAVRAFQSHRGLQADGIVGPKTWNALRTTSSSPNHVPGKAKPTAARGYLLKFTNNWNDPQNSRLALLRHGKEVVSHRAGSGKDVSRNECASGTGWLPSGTYDIEQHTTSRGADAKPWNQPSVQGYVIQLADKVCKPVSGQKAVTRTELFIHSEMKADGTQGFSIFEDDSLRRWEDERDYKSSGCIKLAPNHIKDLFAHLDRAGWPQGLALQVS